MKYQAPRGTHDYTPPGSLAFRSLALTAEQVFSLYGFLPIETPIFEATDLFTRSIGEETDIVSKEMYTFADRKGRSLTLRPEGTASAVRAYLEHGLGELGFNRFQYFGPMFRYERPQAGRTRQFYQVGVEAFGEAGPAVDAEVIDSFVRFASTLGLEGLEVKLNSVGCPECRKVWVERLKASLADATASLCELCRVRLERNPMRILDCKVASCQERYRDLPTLVSQLCDPCCEHFRGVREGLDLLGVPYRLEPNLVRGLDYYTRTAFEVSSSHLGAQDALGGGGRYDLLVEQFGGKPTPAVGFAAGVERLLMVLEKTATARPPAYAGAVYLAALGSRARAKGMELASKLRTQQVRCVLDSTGDGLGKKLKTASRMGFGKTLILGDPELDAGQVLVKDMATGHQETIELAAVAASLGSPKEP
ncbi:MAG: histidine--tRNA ligase [Candidatus Riflebacteria bacterium]|nr:histidine--tRNA ligase [Candidatus Riflebacteria bacterium]